MDAVLVDAAPEALTLDWTAWIGLPSAKEAAYQSPPAVAAQAVVGVAQLPVSAAAGAAAAASGQNSDAVAKAALAVMTALPVGRVRKGRARVHLGALVSRP